MDVHCGSHIRGMYVSRGPNTLYEKNNIDIMDEKMDEGDNMNEMNIWTIWTWTLKKIS
jgi:hypothetical protein